MNLFVATFNGAVIPKTLAEKARKENMIIPFYLCDEMSLDVQLIKDDIPEQSNLDDIAEVLKEEFNNENPFLEMLVCQFYGYRNIIKIKGPQKTKLSRKLKRIKRLLKIDSSKECYIIL